MCEFREACATYKLLRTRGYPEKATLKLVGDRHRLTRVQRNCIFRGVVPPEAALRRQAKLVSPEAVQGKLLAVDWYNVLITVESYLKGDTVFLADDGVVRDASATHGSYRTSAVTERAVSELVEEVARCAPARVEAYLDVPIAFSGRMADNVRQRFQGCPFEASASLAPSADFPLKASPGIVASSDSAVLEACVQAVDLARVVLERRFGFTPPGVQELFAEHRGGLPQ